MVKYSRNSVGVFDVDFYVKSLKVGIKYDKNVLHKLFYYSCLYRDYDSMKFLVNFFDINNYNYMDVICDFKMFNFFLKNGYKFRFCKNNNIYVKRYNILLCLMYYFSNYYNDVDKLILQKIYNIHCLTCAGT